MNQVEEKNSLVLAFEEETIEVECLLMEPPTDPLSVDDVLCFHKENLGKFTEIVDTSCPFRITCGLDSDAVVKREQTSEFSVFDVLSHEVEVGNSLAADEAFACEDYLLDNGSSESVGCQDHDSSDGLYFWDSSSDDRIASHVSADSCNFRMTNMSTETVSIAKCQKDLVGKIVYESNKTEGGDNFKCSNSSVSRNIVELEDSSNFSTPHVSTETVSVSDCQKGLVGKTMNKSKKAEAGNNSKCSNSSLSQNSVKLKDAPSFFTEGFSSNDWDLPTKSPAEMSSDGPLHPQKRSRKPPQRYIDEFSVISSKYCRRIRETSSTLEKEKFGVLNLRRSHRMGCEMKIMSHEEPFGEAIQVPFDDTQIPTEFHEDHVSISSQTSDDELYLSGSGSDSETSSVKCRQRKVNKYWTHSEVKNLIDGVSLFGVGNWSLMKRLLFSRSYHRTPENLKDKWRNLLRASSLLKKRKKEERRNLDWHFLPKSMLNRVRELATLYPYPNERLSKTSKANISTAPSPIFLPKKRLQAKLQSKRVQGFLF